MAARKLPCLHLLLPPHCWIKMQINLLWDSWLPFPCNSDWWLSIAYLLHYQTLLINPGWDISLPPVSLIPATLPPDPDMDCLLHHCDEVVAQVHCTQPGSETEQIWFIDRSRFIHEGQRSKGALMTTEVDVIWTQSLSSGTLTQRATLITVIQVLIMGKGLAVISGGR